MYDATSLDDKKTFSAFAEFDETKETALPAFYLVLYLSILFTEIILCHFRVNTSQPLKWKCNLEDWPGVCLLPLKMSAETALLFGTNSTYKQIVAESTENKTADGHQISTTEAAKNGSDNEVKNISRRCDVFERRKEEAERLATDW